MVFMCAVCLVCLLCANHVHCQEHLQKSKGVEFNSLGEQQEQPLQQQRDILNATINKHNKVLSLLAHNDGDGDSKYSSFHYRRKRHHAEEHTHEAPAIPKITENFIQRIFSAYGDQDGSINKTSFQSMLKQFGLYQLIADKYNNNESKDDIDENNCISDTTMVEHVKQPHGLVPHDATHKRSEIRPINNTQENYSLKQQDVINLCPVLLYQLVSKSNVERSGCINESILRSIAEDIPKMDKEDDDTLFVWIYAFVSVFACSILGLIGVAIIPFMDSRFYKHIIQFLVALAVGTMTGDALLHLFPHSLAGQTESNMIFKGLTCMGGIMFFYITEHGLTMISEWRKRIAKKESKKPQFAKVMREQDSCVNDTEDGGKLCKSKYSSYPYCYDEIAMNASNDMWLHMPKSAAAEEQSKSTADDVNATADQALLYASKSYNAANANYKQQQQQQQQDSAENNAAMKDAIDSGAMGDGKSMSINKKFNGTSNEGVTVILREHESSHHGHSHKHGHVHSPPESLSAVAWMIIMGDGLHNFTDGMAIGAAFAENIGGGFSTSLAVFCHELPHELGDFAILMKAGMSVKSAVYYNLLTGVLSFIGMIVGIVFGQSKDAAQWMFAAASGLFIYIALVDMMPELTSTHKSVMQLTLQTIGMSIGVLLMLLLAIYEGDLMSVFSSQPSSVYDSHHVH